MGASGFGRDAKDLLDLLSEGYGFVGSSIGILRELLPRYLCVYGWN
jgi:hypothetical protein